MERLPKVVWLVPAAMLVFALAPLPYWYYVLLRLTVCGVCAYLAWVHVREIGFGGWALGLAAAAILFNPFISLHLTRATWLPIDVALAAFLLLHMHSNRRQGSTE